MHDDALPVLPHLTSEFYLWVWWMSETHDGRLPTDLGGQPEPILVWVDDRLAFRDRNTSKVTTVVTSEDTGASVVSQAAAASGKAVDELRIGLRRDDREFFVTLKGPEILFSSVKLPEVLAESVDEMVYDRMFLWAELEGLVEGMFREFARQRTSDAWHFEVVPQICAWLGV